MDAPPSYEAAMAESNRRISAPAATYRVPKTPPVFSEEPTTPPTFSVKPTTPPVLSEKPMTPRVLCDEPMTPVVLSEVPATPPTTYIAPSVPPVSSQVPSTPPVSSQVPSTPPVLSDVPLAPVTPPVLPDVPAVPVTLPIAHKEPSAPPVAELSTNSQYSQVASASPIPPASYILPALQPTIGSLTDETIRKVCYDFAEKNFKNGTSIIEHMSFTNIRSCYSLHYQLETFWESREFVMKNEKSCGKSVDGPNNGPEPNLRSIFVVCKQKFQNGETRVAVPHSEHLRNCQKCDDRGKEDCLICKGAGWNHCSCCSGDGYLKDRSACLTCNKSGRLICDPCYSSGRINCSVCDGYKKLKSYKELKVTWTNHVDVFDVNPTDIPTVLLKSSTSNEILCEESPRVQPLTTFPDARINIASLNLVFKHQKDFANKVVLLQRHSVRAVPITKINYFCKGKTGEFYVYGNDNCVYFDNYSELLD